MPRFNVEGADSRTGEDRVVQIEAENQRAAEQAARESGLLVSNVFEAVTRTKSEELDALAEAARDAKAAAAPSPPVFHYEAPRHHGVPPDYFGLRIGKTVLMVVAGLYYTIGLLGIGMAILIAFASFNARTRTPLDAIGVFGSLLYALISVSVGGLFHALSEGCAALRDIARNSWR